MRSFYILLEAENGQLLGCQRRHSGLFWTKILCTIFALQVPISIIFCPHKIRCCRHQPNSADALILYCISIEFPNDLVRHVLSDSFLLDKVALLQSGKVPPNCAKIILRHRYKSKCIWGKLLQNKAGATAGSTIWSGHFYFYHIGAKIMIILPFVPDRYTNFNVSKRLSGLKGGIIWLNFNQ